MTWALENGEGSFALRLSVVLPPFWEVRGHFTEGRQWLTKALDQGQDASAALRAAAFTGAGTMAFYREALSLCQAHDNYEQTAECLEGMAHAAARCAQSERAARLLGVAERLREVIGAPLEVVAHHEYATVVAIVRSALDPATFERIRLDGRAMLLDKAIAYALSSNEP